MNGDIATSNCILLEQNTYSDEYGTGDPVHAALDDILANDHEFSIRETTMTDEETTTDQIGNQEAGFGHRKVYTASPNKQCAVRVRLTPSKPHQASSVWYADPMRILDGFETEFTFQISDQSRRCYEATDQHFSLNHFKVHSDGWILLLFHITLELHRSRRRWICLCHSRRRRENCSVGWNGSRSRIRRDQKLDCD